MADNLRKTWRIFSDLDTIRSLPEWAKIVTGVGGLLGPLLWGIYAYVSSIPGPWLILGALATALALVSLIPRLLVLFKNTGRSGSRISVENQPIPNRIYTECCLPDYRHFHQQHFIDFPFSVVNACGRNISGISEVSGRATIAGHPFQQPIELRRMFLSIAPGDSGLLTLRQFLNYDEKSRVMRARESVGDTIDTSDPKFGFAEANLEFKCGEERYKMRLSDIVIMPSAKKRFRMKAGMHCEEGKQYKPDDIVLLTHREVFDMMNNIEPLRD